MYEAIDEALKTMIKPKIMNTNMTINNGLSNFVFFMISLSFYINITKIRKKVNSNNEVYFYFTIIFLT